MNVSMYAYFSSMLYKKGIDCAIDFARKKGFSSVEFLEIPNASRPLRIASVEQATEIKQALDQNGLSVACYSVGITVLDPATATPIERNVGELLQAVEIAAALGSPYFHHTLILNTSVTRHKDYLPFDALLDPLVSVALPIAKKANALGIKVLYEPQGFYVNGLDNFGAFYNRMKAEGCNVGVCGDLGNSLFVDVDPVDFVRTFGHEICHVHLKDYQTKPLAAPEETQSIGGNKLTQVILGDGCIDLNACFSLLREVGYSGAYALEGSYPDDAVEQGFDLELDFLKKIL